MLRCYLFLCCYLLSSLVASAQKVYVNTPTAVYELNTQGNLCQSIDLQLDCAANQSGSFFTSAIYKDNFYFIVVSGGGQSPLYRKILPNGPCTQLTTFVAEAPFTFTNFNSMTVSKDHKLYMIDYYSLNLIRYDPATNNTEMLGKVPQPPAGDMLFFNNKLLYSALGNRIYEVNISNPAASTVYMPTPQYNFYGLVSFPFNCSRNRYFGLAGLIDETTIVELDLANKSIIGPVCDLPLWIFDAASNVETGNTIGVSLDSIIIHPPCDPALNSGSVEFLAGSAADNSILTFTLDNTISNNTGVFNNVPLGQHTIRIESTLGCRKDSVFTMAHGLSPTIGLAITPPLDCNTKNGSVTITANSFYTPLRYSINGGIPQTNPTFTQLDAGIHTLNIQDATGCRRDTTIILRYLTKPAFIDQIIVTPTYCKSNSGSIKITSAVQGVTASINGQSPDPSLQFLHLAAGNYLLSVFTTGNCRFDSVINIQELRDNDPQISISLKHQECFTNNGSITLNVTGNGAPFVFSKNNEAFKTQSVYPNLAPGIHDFIIQNKNLCEWNATAEILAYPKNPVNLQVNTQMPTCEEPSIGSASIAVTGPDAPYTLRFNQVLYPVSSINLSNMTMGDYPLTVFNKDACVVEERTIVLAPVWTPACDNVYIPSAFTPNADGINDVFAPVFTPFISAIQFRIFNRNGEVIFHSTNNKAWDGKIRGIPQPPGVYVWSLSYETFGRNKKQAKGHLTLIR